VVVNNAAPMLLKGAHEPQAIYELETIVAAE
jgi:hypothetical protein